MLPKPTQTRHSELALSSFLFKLKANEFVHTWGYLPIDIARHIYICARHTAHQSFH